MHYRVIGSGDAHDPIHYAWEENVRVIHRLAAKGWRLAAVTLRVSSRLSAKSCSVFIVCLTRWLEGYITTTIDIRFAMK